MFNSATVAIALTAALLNGGIAAPPASSPAQSGPQTPHIAVIDKPVADAGIGCWLLFWSCR